MEGMNKSNHSTLSFSLRNLILFLTFQPLLVSTSWTAGFIGGVINNQYFIFTEASTGHVGLVTAWCGSGKVSCKNYVVEGCREYLHFLPQGNQFLFVSTRAEEQMQRTVYTYCLKNRASAPALQPSASMRQLSAALLIQLHFICMAHITICAYLGVNLHI